MGLMALPRDGAASLRNIMTNAQPQAGSQHHPPPRVFVHTQLRVVALSVACAGAGTVTHSTIRPIAARWARMNISDPHQHGISTRAQPLRSRLG